MIMPGGVLRRASESMVGFFGDVLEGRGQVDKGFFGVVGLSLQRGLLDLTPEEARAKEAMAAVCRRVYGIFDSSKVERFGTHPFLPGGPDHRPDLRHRRARRIPDRVGRRRRHLGPRGPRPDPDGEPPRMTTGTARATVAAVDLGAESGRVARVGFDGDAARPSTSSTASRIPLATSTESSAGTWPPSRAASGTASAPSRTATPRSPASAWTAGASTTGSSTPTAPRRRADLLPRRSPGRHLSTRPSTRSAPVALPGHRRPDHPDQHRVRPRLRRPHPPRPAREGVQPADAPRRLPPPALRQPRHRVLRGLHHRLLRHGAQRLGHRSARRARHPDPHAPRGRPARHRRRPAPDRARHRPLSTTRVVMPPGHDTASAVVGTPLAHPDGLYISSGTWSLVASRSAAGHQRRHPGPEHHQRGRVCGHDPLAAQRRRALAPPGVPPGLGRGGPDLHLPGAGHPGRQATGLDSIVNPDAPEFLDGPDAPSRIQAYCAATGTTVAETPGEIVRCTLDSLALSYRAVVDDLTEVTGHAIPSVNIVGGGSNNTLLSQLTADATGLPVHCGPVEATALGNAATQLVALGELADLADIRRVIAGTTDITSYAPSPRLRPVGRRLRPLHPPAGPRPRAARPRRPRHEGLMTHTTWEPDLVSPALVALTTLLGEPARDLAVLAEGNTSELLDDGRLVVKASGAGLAVATAEDFVVVDLDEVMAVVDDPATTQADLSAVLVAPGTDRPDGAGPRRGSIETVVHAAIHTVARDAGIVDTARFIGHTHPTDVVGLLASVRARRPGPASSTPTRRSSSAAPSSSRTRRRASRSAAFYAVALRDVRREHGALPQLVLLANHGIVAIAPTAAGRRGGLDDGGQGGPGPHDGLRGRRRRAALRRGRREVLRARRHRRAARQPRPGPLMPLPDADRGGLLRRRRTDLLRRQLRQRGPSRPRRDPRRARPSAGRPGRLRPDLRPRPGRAVRQSSARALATELLGDESYRDELHRRLARTGPTRGHACIPDALEMFRAPARPRPARDRRQPGGGHRRRADPGRVRALRRRLGHLRGRRSREAEPRVLRVGAARSAATDAEHTVHIGNRLDTDVRPAKALGIGTIWVIRGEAPTRPDRRSSWPRPTWPSRPHHGRRRHPRRAAS